MAAQIRLACAVPNVKPGNIQNNVAQICKWMTTAAEEQCDAILFPELAVTGCTCMDLFFQETLIAGACRGLAGILSHSCQYPPLTAVVGMPLRISGTLCNCAVVVRNGRVVGIVPKSVLSPAERRWFADTDAIEVAAQQLGLGEDYRICVSKDITFPLANTVACVDIWGDGIPEHRKYPAPVVLAMAAAPELVGSSLYRKQLLCDSFKGVVAYVSAGSGESNQDHIYSGHSFIVCNGSVLAEGNPAPGTNHIVISQVQPGKRNACIKWEKPAHTATRNPFLPETDRQELALSAFRIQAAALAKRLIEIDARPVIGISGGLDSTLALLVAAEAVHMLERPAADVVGITMPCFGTTKRTKNNAWDLMEHLGITALQIDIRQAVEQHYRDIGHNGRDYDTTYENAQARERTQVLMDYAGRVGGIVVGTGDLSELALGWCTYNGDHMSMYSVNSSVPKTVIPMIIEAVATLPRYAPAASILQDVIDTPISPELLPPDKDGNIAQQTQDLVGPYALHDFFLYYLLKCGWTPSQIYRHACDAFSDEYDGAAVKKWLRVFYKRFFTQQFKRSCMPEGVQVFDISLSPRGGLQMPSDGAASLWLEEVEAL